MVERSREEVERRAQAGMEARGGAALARDLLDLLAKQPVGVLATISVRHGGAPFTSLVPFAIGADGEVVFLLSSIAQHTRNLEADPRASLLVHDASAAAEDPRTAARVALVGRVRRLTPGEEADARARYLARHPGARGLLALDFALFRLDVEEAQLVGGFAAAGWLSAAELRGAAAP
jgi:putative heme iron utilization protein